MEAAGKIRNLRWYICGLLFLATVFNYLDRQVFSILAPDLQKDLGWSELDYGRIVITFQLAYAISLMASGKLIDRIGTRIGYAAAVIWWGLAEMAHALARSPFGFGVVRAVLGIGQAANFPAAVKAIAEWFPKSESGLATGILFSGPTVGAIAAPVFVPLVAARFGWRAAFVMTGAFEAAWLAAWWKLYRRPEEHSRITPEELSIIDRGRSRSAAARIPFWRLLAYRQTWAFGIAKLLADPAWFFYLFWLPKFLAQQYGLRGTAAVPYLTSIYVLCGIGSTLGGYVSSLLIRFGWTVNWSRKAAMAPSAFFMPVIIFASHARNPWTVTVLMGLVLAAHQSWSTLAFTIGTDMFPSRAMASATGIAVAMGSAGTVVFSEITGRVLQRDPNNYQPMFVACGTMYALAFIIIQILAPRLEPAAIESKGESPA